MNVNKKNILRIILILTLNLFITNVHAFKVTTGQIQYAGVGDSNTHAPFKYNNDNKDLLYCTQFRKDRPSSCQGTKKSLYDEVLAGIDVILTNSGNYICKEVLLTKFLYNKYNSTGRTNFTIYENPIEKKNSKGEVTKARWNYSCPDAQDIYDSALAKYNEIVALKNTTPSFSPESLNFSYNSSSQEYEATVSISDSIEDYDYDYECTVDNDASISYNDNNVTVSVSPDKSGETITLTCNLKTNINATTYYYCGDNVQDVITDTTTIKKITSKEATATGKFEDKGSIQLRKVNTAGKEIIGKDVGIELYNGHDCDQANINDSVNTFQSGREISLEPGNYSIKETTPPTGYEIDGTCYNFTIEAGKKSADLKIKNVSTCVSDVMGLIYNNQANDRSERIRIYKKYNTNINSINNLKFTNLLNFNLEYVTGSDKEAFANSVCSQADCSDNYLDFHCLYAETALSDFDSNNLACYTSTIDQSNNTGFCQTKFEFDRLGSSVSPVEAGGYYFLTTSSIKNGQFVFKSDYLGTAVLSQICYFENDLNVDEIDAGVYDDYVQRVGFDMKEVSKEENQNEDLILKRIGTNVFQGNLSIKYIMDEVYVEKISGKRCSQEQIEADKNSVVKKCKNIGRGLISDFEDANFSKAMEFSINNDGGTYMSVQFSVSLNQSKLAISGNNKYITEGSCVYPIKPEVITYDDKPNGELEIEFRTIDTNNPFNRNTRSNWGDGTNKSKNNKTVKENITNSDVNNSYNRTGEGSLYTNQTDGTKRIILTPALVQSIREYNKANPYDDYTVYTEEDESRKTKTSTSFFDYIGLTKVQ